MTKKHLIALADAIRQHNSSAAWNANTKGTPFTEDQLDTLAQFCRESNPRFMRDRWIGYIRGENGPNGGAR